MAKYSYNIDHDTAEARDGKIPEYAYDLDYDRVNAIVQWYRINRDGIAIEKNLTESIESDAEMPAHTQHHISVTPAIPECLLPPISPVNNKVVAAAIIEVNRG